MVNDKSDKLPFLLQLINLNYLTMHRKRNYIEDMFYSFSFFFFFSLFLCPFVSFYVNWAYFK